MSLPTFTGILGIYFPSREETAAASPPPASSPAVSPFVHNVSNADLEIILDLIDVLHTPPPQATPEYNSICQRVSDFLNAHIPQKIDPIIKSGWTFGKFPEQGNVSSATGSPNDPGSFPDGGWTSHQIDAISANYARQNIYDFINAVNSFIARAKNAGFQPLENPFVVCASYNEGRTGFTPINISSEKATSLANDIRKYVDLIRADRAGNLSLDAPIDKAAQISSARFSFDGMGGTGNTSVDLSKIFPDQDTLKEKRALESLSIFDFSKRTPRVIFTTSYAPDGTLKGMIIGWKKIPDAAGYVIKRRDLFTGHERTYVVDNALAQASTERLSSYVKAWVLTFYDNIRHDSVYSYLDADLSSDSYYVYKVQAFQNKNDRPGAIFNVETSPVKFTGDDKRSIRSQLERLDPGKGADSISPYPILSHFLFGNSKYDWLLAAVNTRASANRLDSRTTTRGFSYLAAQLDFIFLQADNGKFVVPKGKNLGPVFDNISDAISRFGCSQVIGEVLKETGALYHFDGKDPIDEGTFQDLSNPQSPGSGIVAVVAAAIDPENATMDLKNLSSNLPRLLAGEFVASSDRLGVLNRPKGKSSSTGEIDPPAEFDSTTSVNSEDEIQFLSKLGDLSETIADLTTVEGIGLFMRTVRIFSDVGPSRGTPITQKPTTAVADPVSIPTPPAGPEIVQKTPAQPGKSFIAAVDEVAKSGIGADSKSFLQIVDDATKDDKK